MRVGVVRNISAISSISLEDAITRALVGASGAVCDVQSAWIKDRHVKAGDRGSDRLFEVDMVVAFAAEE